MGSFYEFCSKLKHKDRREKPSMFTVNDLVNLSFHVLIPRDIPRDAPQNATFYLTKWDRVANVAVTTSHLPHRSG